MAETILDKKQEGILPSGKVRILPPKTYDQLTPEEKHYADAGDAATMKAREEKRLRDLAENRELEWFQK